MKWFNFFSRETPEAPKLTHVDRVHLIVHPGDGLTEKNIAAEKNLLKEMAARAISLERRNQIAVVLLQMNQQEWDSVRDTQYKGKERILADAVGRIESFIPNNVVIVPGAGSVDELFLQDIFDDVADTIKERGFVIDPQTNLLAYGEQVIKCVPAAAVHFAEHFHLENSPTIDVNYTDARIADSVTWKRGGVRLAVEQALRGNALQYIPIGETDAA